MSRKGVNKGDTNNTEMTYEKRRQQGFEPTLSSWSWRWWSKWPRRWGETRRSPRDVAGVFACVGEKEKRTEMGGRTSNSLPTWQLHARELD
jgi:hypothetical protein